MEDPLVRCFFEGAGTSLFGENPQYMEQLTKLRTVHLLELGLLRLVPGKTRREMQFSGETFASQAPAAWREVYTLAWQARSTPSLVNRVIATGIFDKTLPAQPRSADAVQTPSPQKWDAWVDSSRSLRRSVFSEARKMWVDASASGGIVFCGARDSQKQKERDIFFALHPELDIVVDESPKVLVSHPALVYPYAKAVPAAVEKHRIPMEEELCELAQAWTELMRAHDASGDGDELVRGWKRKLNSYFALMMDKHVPWVEAQHTKQRQMHSVDLEEIPRSAWSNKVEWMATEQCKRWQAVPKPEQMSKMCAALTAVFTTEPQLMPYATLFEQFLRANQTRVYDRVCARLALSGELALVEDNSNFFASLERQAMEQVFCRWVESERLHFPRVLMTAAELGTMPKMVVKKKVSNFASEKGQMAMRELEFLRTHIPKVERILQDTPDLALLPHDFLAKMRDAYVQFVHHAKWVERNEQAFTPKFVFDMKMEKESIHAAMERLGVQFESYTHKHEQTMHRLNGMLKDFGTPESTLEVMRPHADAGYYASLHLLRKHYEKPLDKMTRDVAKNKMIAAIDMLKHRAEPVQAREMLSLTRLMRFYNQPESNAF